MRKFYIAALALVAVLAFGVLSASSVFASETAPELLINKAAVTAEKELNGSGELELIDTKTLLGEVAVKCSGILMGNVLTGGKEGETTSLLNLAGTEEITSTKQLTCTNIKNCAEPLAYAVNLPWKWSLEYMAPPRPWKWLFVYLSPVHVGWHVECMSLKVTDECTAQESRPRPGFLLENMTGGILLGVFLRTETEEEKSSASCTSGTSESGFVSASEEGGQLESGTSELEVS